jgi:hypothetical protein
VRLPDRFFDEYQLLSDFADEMLLVCPKCQGCARSVMTEAFQSARRLTCTRCGHTRESDGVPVRPRASDLERDVYFGLALWLQTPCAGEVLWAYNRRHLSLLESFVRAKHRERPREATMRRNKSVASRLPKWLKSAKHREQVLRAIDKLRTRQG